LSETPPLLLQHLLPVVELNQTIVIYPEVLSDTTRLLLTEGSPEPELYGRNLILNATLYRLAVNVPLDLLRDRSAMLIHLHLRRKKMYRLELEGWMVLILHKETLQTRSWRYFTVNGTLDVGCKCSSDTKHTAHLNR
jgi:hypothetical protein